MAEDTEEEQGGRVFFSNAGRTLEGEDEIQLTSVGVDIGSSTSHLVFSRLLLERLDNRYVVTEREILHESDVLLTPYAADTTIDPMALGLFIARQYALAGIDPTEIDTGALILTGVAARRRNARAIGELFAAEAGKFVAVSAGDALETTLAAYGSGAVALSIREGARVMNVDIGGGTSKIAVCLDGDVVGITAIDVGARVVCLDEESRVTRIEEAGRRFAAEFGIDLKTGMTLSGDQAASIAERMADRLFEAMSASILSPETSALLRLDALPVGPTPDFLSFSGGVSEYIYGREPDAFGDLGPQLATAVRSRAELWGPRIERPVQGIRATVVGASQYTIQVSGSTIYVEPRSTLPLRNIPVIVPELPLADEVLAPDALARGVRAALQRLDLEQGKRPVALCFHWQGSATFARLDAFCRGLAEGLGPVLQQGHPLVLVSDGDIGGLLGIHAREEARLDCPVVSIDGIRLQEFDYIDIGALLEASGAVPVVIKSLVFPTSAALGKAAG